MGTQGIFLLVGVLSLLALLVGAGMLLFKGVRANGKVVMLVGFVGLVIGSGFQWPQEKAANLGGASGGMAAQYVSVLAGQLLLIGTVFLFFKRLRRWGKYMALAGVLVWVGQTTILGEGDGVKRGGTARAGDEQVAKRKTADAGKQNDVNDFNPKFVRRDKTTNAKHIAMIDESLKALRVRLMDADSARFRDVYLHSKAGGTIATCGEVNSKNAFGAYAGYQRFVAAPAGNIAVLASDMERGEFDKVWNQICR